MGRLSRDVYFFKKSTAISLSLSLSHSIFSRHQDAEKGNFSFAKRAPLSLSLLLGQNSKLSLPEGGERGHHIRVRCVRARLPRVRCVIPWSKPMREERCTRARGVNALSPLGRDREGSSGETGGKLADRERKRERETRHTVRTHVQEARTARGRERARYIVKVRECRAAHTPSIRGTLLLPSSSPALARIGAIAAETEKRITVAARLFILLNPHRRNRPVESCFRRRHPGFILSRL